MACADGVGHCMCVCTHGEHCSLSQQQPILVGVWYRELGDTLCYHKTKQLRYWGGVTMYMYLHMRDCQIEPLVFGGRYDYVWR